MIRWIRSHEKTLYRAVNAGLMICMVLLGAGSYFGIEMLGMPHFIVAFAILGMLACMNDMTVRSRIICLAVLLIMLCGGIAAGSQDFWRMFLRWQAGREKAPQEWARAYGLIQTAMLTAGCYLAQIPFDRLPFLKAGAAGFPLGILIFCLMNRRQVNHFGMAFMVCFLLLIWLELVQRNWERRRMEERGIQSHIFWILPFLGLYLVFLMIVPAPEKPYDWHWAKAIYRQIQESFRTYTQKVRWGDQEGFSMAFTGFSGEGTLGGDMQEEAREVMRVQIRPSAADYLYLTGVVYDTFDGREWSRRQREYGDEVFLDTAETLYAVRRYDDRYQRDYLKEIRVTIRYEDLSTGYAFAPLKTWGLEEASGAEADIVCEDGTLRWNERKGYGMEYSLRYYAMNTGQPQFERFLEETGSPKGIRRQEEAGSPEGIRRQEEAGSSEGIRRQEEAGSLEGVHLQGEGYNPEEAYSPSGQEEISGKVWREIMKECEKRNGRTFTLQDLADYENMVYELYQGEVRLSEELEGRLKEIVKGAETDLEKLRALEGYLSSLTYTLTPGSLPGSVGNAGDFLDYFLLESRRGYCTYFATAFVLLARAEGIPARYVQGYCIPIGEQGDASVYSDMAHAWPEAYLEGVGWIPFEPTPGYGSRRYHPWAVQQSVAGLAGESTPREWNFGSGLEGTAGDYGETVDVEDTGNMAFIPEEGKGSPYPWHLFGAVALAVLSGCTGLLAFDHALGKYRYGKKSPQERLRTEVLLNLKVLSLLVPERESWETLEEFRVKTGRLPGKQGEERELPLRFTEDYEKVIYGGKAVGEEMITNAIREREEILELLKQGSRLRWIYCRIRLYFGRYKF